MDQPHAPSVEQETTHDRLADELRAMIARWDGIDSPRKDEIVAGLQSVIDEGGVPLEEVEAWVNSWDSSEELPPPQSRK